MSRPYNAANSLENTQEYQRSAKQYLRYCSLFPDREDAPKTAAGEAYFQLWGASNAATRGDSEAAAERAEEALRLLPVSADAMDGTDVLFQAAAVFARIGQAQRAMDVLEELMSVPSSYTTANISLDPAFDGIRDDGRYQALVGG